MDEKELFRFKSAQKQMKKGKCFYNHLFTFLIFVPLIFIIRFYVLPKLGIVSEEKGFHDWLDWNTYLLPLLWIVALGMHAIVVFKFKFIQRWEDQKIKEIINKEAEKSRQTWN